MIEETPGGPLVRHYITRDGKRGPVPAALVTRDNMGDIAHWCGGTLEERGVLVQWRPGAAALARPGCYVARHGGEDPRFMVWAGAEWEARFVLESVAAADEWARAEVLGRTGGAS